MASPLSMRWDNTAFCHRSVSLVDRDSWHQRPPAVSLAREGRAVLDTAGLAASECRNCWLRYRVDCLTGQLAATTA